jgi:hypothetical protein
MLVRADILIAELGGAYRRVLQDLFSPDRQSNPPPEWIRSLFDLPLRSLLTSNYSAELEIAARDHPSQPLGVLPQPIMWYQQPQITNALRFTSGRPSLVYLHGRYSDDPTYSLNEHGVLWSKVILGEKAYKYAYIEPGILKKALEKMFSQAPVLVVGSSLEDADLLSPLRLLATVGLSPTGFAVVPDTLPDGKRLEIRERLGLDLLTYGVEERSDGSVDHTSGLNSLIHWLAEQLGTARAPRSTAKPVGHIFGEVMPTPKIAHPLPGASSFEPRPTYQHVLSVFRGRQHGGALALVGIGGSGKTALLVEWLTEHVFTERQGFDGVFVWSFDEEPDPAACLRSLADYLGLTDRSEFLTEYGLYHVIRNALAGPKRLLIVLDGLEKIQTNSPDFRRAHGEIESPAIADLLLWLCQSTVASRAVITTRFALPSLASSSKKNRYQAIDIDFLTRPQARSLMRHRGVVGADGVLDEVLDHYGAHALTVDHLAGVITNYLDCDPSRYRELGSGPLPRWQAGQAGARLARVVEAYREYLARDEPEVWAALELLALMPRAEPVDLLIKVWQGQAKDIGETGSDLRFLGHLRRLVDLRIATVSGFGGTKRFGLHPAIRDSINLEARMGERGRHVLATTRSHLETILLTSGVDRISVGQDDVADILEDLTRITADVGDVKGAMVRYFASGLDYSNLGQRLGNFARGHALAGHLLHVASEAREDRSLVARLQLEDAAYSFALGLLGRSSSLLPHAEVGVQDLSDRVSTAMLRADVEATKGNFAAATHAAEAAYRMTRRRGSAVEPSPAAAMLGYCQLLAGDMVAAADSFLWAFDHHVEAHGIVRGWDLPRRGWCFGAFLIKLERYDLAHSLSEATRNYGSAGNGEAFARQAILSTEALLGLGLRAGATEELARATPWIERSRHAELVAYRYLMSSRLALAQGNASAAADEAKAGIEWCKPRQLGLHLAPLELALSTAESHERQSSANGTRVASGERKAEKSAGSIAVVNWVERQLAAFDKFGVVVNK